MLPRRRLQPAAEVTFLHVGFHVRPCSDPESRIAHDQDHPDDRILLMLPKHGQFLVRKRFKMLIGLGIRQDQVPGSILAAVSPGNRKAVQLPDQLHCLGNRRDVLPGMIHNALQLFDRQVIQVPVPDR